jgi:hypothetical protein
MPAPKLDDIDLDRLPSRVADLAQVIGLPAALALVEAYGGRSIWVPKKASEQHWLAELIGMDAFASLCAAYGYTALEIDRCAAAIRATVEARIVREHAQGASNNELAGRYGYTARGIKKLRRRVENRLPSPNYDLFDEI